MMSLTHINSLNPLRGFEGIMSLTYRRYNPRGVVTNGYYQRMLMLVWFLSYCVDINEDDDILIWF